MFDDIDLEASPRLSLDKNAEFLKGSGIEFRNEIIDLFKSGLSISLPMEEQEEISKYIAKELTIICNKNEQERPLLLQELEKYLGEKRSL